MADVLEIDSKRLMDNILALASIGTAPSGERHRVTFSPSYEEARAFVAAEMRRAGLEVHSDAAGNLIGRMGPSGACIMCGSHIDTVPDGGPLDGAYGVLAGISCAAALAQLGMVLPMALEVVAFADEEGSYVDYLGAGAMMGQFDRTILETENGRTLAAAMRSAGFDPERVGKAVRQSGDIAAYLELHIEQGPVLEKSGIPIGVVEEIVGISRRDFEFLGEAGHAGTTPMTLRRDALAAAADFVHVALDQLAAAGGPQARITFGTIELWPGATNVIPARVRLRQELRHPKQHTLEMLGHASEQIAQQAANQRGCSVDIVRSGGHEAVGLAPEVQQVIESAAWSCGLQTLRLSSGAGHDAQVLAPFVPAGMIFVPSEGGRSHRRDEWTDAGLLTHGASVLLHSLLGLLERADTRSGLVVRQWPPDGTKRQ